MHSLGRALIVGALLLTWAGSSAQATGIYWTNVDQTTGAGSIGHASLDGTGVNFYYIPTNFGDPPVGITSDETSVYWSGMGGQCAPRPGMYNCPGVYRANADGTGLDFILGPGQLGPYFSPGDVAVDDSFIYWTEGGSIGRANLDGSGVWNHSFLSVAATRIAVAGGFVYWTSGGSIGRANLDGTGVDPGFITGITSYGVAVDGSFIYWAGGGSIGRANLDGTGVDPGFIVGGDAMYGLDVAGGFVYWSDVFTHAIGRASLDGTGVNQSFITGLDPNSGYDIAVIPTPIPEPTTGSLVVLGLLGLAVRHRRQAATA